MFHTLENAITEVFPRTHSTPKEILYPFGLLRASKARPGPPLMDWNTWSRLVPEDRDLARVYAETIEDGPQYPEAREKSLLSQIRFR